MYNTYVPSCHRCSVRTSQFHNNPTSLLVSIIHPWWIGKTIPMAESERIVRKGPNDCGGNIACSFEIPRRHHLQPWPRRMSVTAPTVQSKGFESLLPHRLMTTTIKSKLFPLDLFLYDHFNNRRPLRHEIRTNVLCLCFEWWSLGRKPHGFKILNAYRIQT